MNKISVTHVCASCGKEETHSYQKEAYNRWIHGESIQKAMPDANTFEREFLITSYCFNCISRIYNMPKPDEDWGEQKGECEVCGAPLWQKDIDAEVCPSCKEPIE